MQAVGPTDVPGDIYGVWDVWKKLIQNTPNFSIWTGTLKRGFLQWEDRFISLFVRSKLIR
jgi:hypothetical protein